MSSVTVWGRWDCTRCSRRDISGEEQRCPECGDPREQHELDAMRPPDEAAFATQAIATPESLATALAGADWSCGFCGSNNRAGGETCHSCGGARNQAKAHGKTGDVAAETAAPKPAKRRSWWKQIAVGSALGVGGLATWGFLDHEVAGSVARLQWQHTTQLQRWQDVNAGDWQTAVQQSPGRPPVAGEGAIAGVRITSCYPKHHHDETYDCGTESYEDRESYTCGETQECSTERNGNGSFTRNCHSVSKQCTRSVTRTRTKRCTRPIDATWCDYVTQAWIDVDKQVIAGEGHEGLRFAELATHGDRERTTLAGEYTVVFQYGADHANHAIQVPRPTYDGWQLGDAVIVVVERLGGVVEVRRAHEKGPRAPDR